MLDVFLDSMVRAGRIDGPAQPWLPSSHPFFEHTCLQPPADEARQRWTPSSQPRPVRRATAWLLRALGMALVCAGQALEWAGGLMPELGSEHLAPPPETRRHHHRGWAGWQ
jgi:hypothetical protein